MKTAYRACSLLILCLPVMLLVTRQAQAQCAPRDVMRRNPGFIASSSETVRPAPRPAPGPASSESIAGIGVWKSIQVGTFASKKALYGAFEDADCEIGDT